MRRLRPRRNRQQEQGPIPEVSDEEELAFEPLVHVTRTPGDNEPGAEVRRRIRLPRVTQPQIALPNFRFGLLLLVVVLIGGGIFGVLLNQGRIRDDVEAWWPLVLVIGALGWMLVALIQRQGTSFLGAAAVTGIGLSLLMETQDIAEVQETLIGVMLVMVGLGIVIRGFLLRQQTV
ncbi:MAG TPA: hypothetical protein VHP83_12970 [Aggregatilineaceae bacterium]|nr:hypothetical protein [Aggregatilineaceae bacterium]